MVNRAATTLVSAAARHAGSGQRSTFTDDHAGERDDHRDPQLPHTHH